MSSDKDFSFSLSVDAITDTADPVPVEFCSTCQRIGLPILPLRTAYAPRPLETQALPLTRGSEISALRLHTDQPRTLRRGFLYVLLDRRVWHAYQITPEGMLRQFRAYQTPREEPRPLTSACIRADHDLPASFINIDTDKFSTAWLAIANDPWPPEVLDRYLRGGVVDGMNLEDRFHKLDLKAARNDPASVGIAMTPTDMGIFHVLDYIPGAGDFHSVHGFYGRNHRLKALMGYVGTLAQEHALPNGVLALVLPDPTGMVQELNAQRLLRYQAMQEWCAEPTRRFEHFTSQALLGIRELMVSRAADAAAKEVREEDHYRRERNDGPLGAKIAVPNIDIDTETERLIPIKQAEARERLADRYDEKARADFEAGYKKTLAAWQRIIDDIGKPYASYYQDAAFQLAARHDYSATNVRSVELFIRMMGACLAGGPTELVEEGELGPTQRLWKAQLEDHNSLLYQALHAKDQTWMEAMGRALIEDERTRIYHGIKTLITTEEATNLMVKPVQNAVGELLGGAAVATNALGKHLSELTKALVGHLHRECLLRYSGVQVTQITVSLKVGEYLTLLNDVLQESTDRFITQLDQQFRKPAERKVRAMLLSNHFAPAVASSHSALIEVKVWTLESAEAVQARLDKLRAGLGEGAGDALRTVSIGGALLNSEMGDFARHLSVNAEVANLMARDAMRSMRTAAISGGPGAFNLALALGSLWFQQDSLRRSYENLVNTLGDERPEAVAAVMSASVGVMGAGVEIVGGTVQMLRPNLMIEVRGVVRPIGLGGRILQFGSAIVSLASAMEGLQYLFAAVRAHRQGDKSAKHFYLGAAALAAVSAGLGIWGSIGAASVLLFPLAGAVFFGLAAYGLAVLAKGDESQPLELWARYSVWGLPEEHRRWKEPRDMDTAIGALNAAVLGLIAEFGVSERVQRPGDKVSGRGGTMEYRVVLPGYHPEASYYEWELRAYRPGDIEGGIIAGGRTDGANGPFPPPALWKRPGYEPETTAPVIYHDAESKRLEIRGSIVFWGALDFHALELEMSYWPDKNDELGVARVIVKEDKINRKAGW